MLPDTPPQALVSFWGCLLLPRPLRKALLNAVMRPFEEPAAALRDDVWLLRHAPLMPRAIPIHGLVNACVCVCVCVFWLGWVFMPAVWHRRQEGGSSSSSTVRRRCQSATTTPTRPHCSCALLHRCTT
jgi:hypothetical protein